MYFLLNAQKNATAPNQTLFDIPNFTFEHLKSHRVQIGEIFFGTDLQGSVYECQLATWDKKKAEAKYQILNQLRKPTTLKHSLIQAIPDKNYLDKLIEIATLSGFEEIILFYSKFSPKYNLSFERLQKISLQAALLAEFSFLPKIRLTEIKDLSSDKNLVNQSIILSQFGTLSYLENTQSRNNDIENNNLGKYVWVGPEGGWDKTETNVFDALNIKKVSLAQGVIYPAWIAGSIWKIQNS